MLRELMFSDNNTIKKYLLTKVCSYIRDKRKIVPFFNSRQYLYSLCYKKPIELSFNLNTIDEEAIEILLYNSCYRTFSSIRLYSNHIFDTRRIVVPLKEIKRKLPIFFKTSPVHFNLVFGKSINPNIFHENDPILFPRCRELEMLKFSILDKIAKSKRNTSKENMEDIFNEFDQLIDFSYRIYKYYDDMFPRNILYTFSGDTHIDLNLFNAFKTNTTIYIYNIDSFKLVIDFMFQFIEDDKNDNDNCNDNCNDNIIEYSN